MVQRTTASAVDIYVQKTMLLARSIVFKSNVSANRLNKYIIGKHGETAVDLDRPRTWKYYMNIAGQYHFTDTMMKVISLDTQELIDFTLENMRIHTATAQAYRYGSRYYFTLVQKYPEQEQLIMAINNPADITEAISAEDGVVLAYYRDLVEAQEYDLIYRIEQFIKNYLIRYTVVGYENVVSAYPVLNYAILAQALSTQIMNIRLDSVKSDRTHSFHITQYLASHGRLDRFIPFMTLKQMLYLYHNIDHIEKFAGHTETFEELVKWILEDRFIPLSSYTVRQLQEYNLKLYPELRARRSPIGSLYNAADSEYIPLSLLLDKESTTQPGNVDYLKLHTEEITHTLETGDSSVIQTKDLESAMIDYTDAVPNTLPEVLLRQWAYMSASGLYNVLTNFIHPFTGERVSLFASDALIYYSYVFMAGIQATPEFIPEFSIIGYRLHPRPRPETLYRDLVPLEFPRLKEIADDLVSGQPTITQCFSTSAFYDLSYKIFQEHQRHWYLTANISDPMERGIVAKMVSRLFGITVLKQAPDRTSMDTWLDEKMLPKFTGTYEESLQLCNTIFEAATGYAIDDTKSLRSIQKAMVEMFTQLSSYSIQIMKEINDSAVIPLNWAAIRVGTKGQEGEDILRITAPVRVIDYTGESIDEVRVPIPGDHAALHPNEVNFDVAVKTGVHVKLCEGMENSIAHHSLHGGGIRVSEQIQDAALSQTPFLPSDYYTTLTQEQLLEIARQYTTLQLEVNHG